MIIGKKRYLSRSFGNSLRVRLQALRWQLYRLGRRKPAIFSFKTLTPVVEDAGRMDEICYDCQKCIELCPTQCLSLRGRMIHLNYLACINCGLCADICPEDMISMVEGFDGPCHGEKGQARPLGFL